MSSDLLFPLILLVGLLAAWMWTFRTARRQEMQKRLAAAVSTSSAAQLARDRAASIRLQQQEATPFTVLARMLKVPQDVPLANVVPPVFMIAIGIIVAAVVFWFGQIFMSPPMSAVLGIVVGILLIRALFGWEIGLYQSKLVKQLPDTIQLIVSGTRAGLPVAEAFRAIAEEMPSPTREEFTRVVNEMSVGGSADQALLSMHNRTGVGEYAILAVTIGVQARSGGRLAETIQTLAETVRERLVISARASALSGEAKVSAIIMGLLPILCGVISSITQPKQIAMLFNDPRGTRMLAIGIITLTLGAATMRWLIRGATKD